MAASYQSKNAQVLNQQLKVQEVCVSATNALLSVSGGNLVLQLSETVGEVLRITKQVAIGTVTGLQLTGAVSGTTIILTGEAAAVATTTYCVKYTIID